MFIPLHDANSLKRIKLQYVTIAVILLNCAVYGLTVMASDTAVQAAVVGLGFIPSVVFDYVSLPPEYHWVPENLTFLTYSFLHADLLHLGGNMIFLWVFGDNVEDALGHFRFLVFYLLCAAAGAWFHGFVAQMSDAPLIGASGAIAGIVSAYLILHPRVKIWILAFGRIPLRIPAWITLALWIGFQFIMFLGGGDSAISWSAHVGGIVAGAVLVLILRRRDQPILDRTVVTPRAVTPIQPDLSQPAVQAGRQKWGR